MTTLSRILLSSSELVLDLLQDKKGTPGFKDNQLVEAKVVQVLGQGKAQLRIEGQLVDVKSQIPLIENEVLYLKVTKTGDSQVLKLVEAHNPVNLPPGLAEMRALGSEGPYEGLARLVNTSVKSGLQSQSLPEPLEPMPKRGDPSQFPTPMSNEKSSPIMAQPTTRTSAVDRQLFNALVKNNTIPFELKLSRVILQDSLEKPQVLKPVLEILNQKLTVLMAGKESSAPVVSQGPENSQAPMQQFGKRVQALINTLAPEDRAVLTRAMETRTLSVGDKLQDLFKSVPESLIRDKGLMEIRDNLIKAFIKTSRMDPGPPIPTATQNTPVPVPRSLPLVIESPPFVNKNVFSQLVARINDMALKPDSTFDAKTLRDLVKNSGLMWENKVRSFAEAHMADRGSLLARESADALLANDVKALSMKLTQSVEPGSQNTVETLKRFVDSLDKMQILNCHSSDETGRFLLPLPFFSGDTLRFGQLLIDLDRRGGSEKKEGDRMVRVAFLLEMSQLGHIQADFAIFKKSLGGEFVVGSPSVKESIDEALPEFQSELALKGYTVTRMECRVTDPETLSRTSLTERMVNTDGGAVNILI